MVISVHPEDLPVLKPQPHRLHPAGWGCPLLPASPLPPATTLPFSQLPCLCIHSVSSGSLSSFIEKGFTRGKSETPHESMAQIRAIPLPQLMLSGRAAHGRSQVRDGEVTPHTHVSSHWFYWELRKRGIERKGENTSVGEKKQIQKRSVSD